MGVTLTVVLAIVSVVGLAISVWAFAISVQSGLWLVTMAAVLLFVASVFAAGLSYSRGHQGWSRQQDRVDRRSITLEPGQSLAFRRMPGRDGYVVVLPENPPGQWTTTRIEPADQDES